jgi:hypothetical protein
MRLVLTERFERSLRETPEPIQRAFLEAIEAPPGEPQSPSLRAKKIDEANDI